MIEKNETLIVGVQIVVKRRCNIPSRYKGMFHGHTNLERGTYMYWFPVKNTSYARMVHEVERWYKDTITIKCGVAGTMEI
jgi:hypothetical protein